MAASDIGDSAASTEAGRDKRTLLPLPTMAAAIADQGNSPPTAVEDQVDLVMAAAIAKQDIPRGQAGHMENFSVLAPDLDN